MKTIKQLTIICITLFVLFCIHPLQVEAAGTITTVNATGQTSGVNVSGTAESDVLAVAVLVRDASDKIVTMETFPVKADGSYQANISYTLEPGKYKVYVADFKGGTWNTKDITVTASSGGGSGTGNSSSSSKKSSSSSGSSSNNAAGNNLGSNALAGTVTGVASTTGNGSGTALAGNSNKQSIVKTENVTDNTADTNSKNEDKKNDASDSDKASDEDKIKDSSEDKDKNSNKEKGAASEKTVNTKDKKTNAPWKVILVVFLVIMFIAITGGVVYSRRKSE